MFLLLLPLQCKLSSHTKISSILFLSNRVNAIMLRQVVKQMVYDQEGVGLKPNTVFWMDVSNARKFKKK
jgi:hypothetical protein